MAQIANIKCIEPSKPDGLTGNGNPKSVADVAVWVKRIALFRAAMAAVLLFGAGCAWAETFRWVDSEGEIHYTDKLPPEEAKRPHAKLSPAAKIKEFIEGQKTQEQLEQFKRLRQLRSDQQIILAKQRKSDKTLLDTYPNEREIQAALQGKINTMDSAKKVAESNRKHQEETLESLVKRAADIEQSGHEVPKNLRDSIESTRNQIAMYQETNRSLENAKMDMVSAFARDLQRFKSLEALRGNSESGSLEWRTQDASADVGVVSAIACKPTECDVAWALAKNYLLEKTGKPLATETESVLQTVGPREERDMALLVVRIQTITQSILFLDTSCHLSSIGDELCAGDTAREIRAGFAPFIEQGLKQAGL